MMCFLSWGRELGFSRAHGGAASREAVQALSERRRRA
jgi:hypothetical protein